MTNGRNTNGDKRRQEADLEAARTEADELYEKQQAARRDRESKDDAQTRRQEASVL